MSRIVVCIVVALASVMGGYAADEPLINAVKTGDRAAVRKLIGEGANINSVEADGGTALHWAVHRDDTETVQLLLSAGANVKAANRYGVTPLSLACLNGNASVVEILLNAGADPNTTLKEGETVLMTAARTGNPDTVKLLLARGADPNVKDAWRGQTALMWAAAEGHVQVVQALIEKGADIHTRSTGNFTALLFAVREGKSEVVKALLEAGANPNETMLTASRQGNIPGAPALVLAVANAHYELATLLMDRGADPNLAPQGWTALHQVTWTRRPGVGDNNPTPQGSGEMDSIEFVKQLVAHGANVNALITKPPAAPGFGECGYRLFCILTDVNMMGATPFLMAARTADVELLRLLVDLGADPLKPNVDNTTPLMIAAGIGTRNAKEDPGTEGEVLEAVKLIVELGGDVNGVDKKGQTAMHGVAAKQVPSVVPYLTSIGVDKKIWTQKNHNGWTPLRIAEGIHRVNAFRSSPEVAAELKKVMIAAGVSTEVEPETIISGETR